MVRGLAMATTSDFETLLDRLRQGCDDAAWQLICEYGPHIVAVVRRRLHRNIRARVDSQDLVQAVWKSFFFDMAGIEDIRSPDQLMAVLVTMTQNKIVDVHRRHVYAERRGVAHETPLACLKEEEGELRPREASPSQFAMARECWQQMLHERTPLQRQIIRLRLAGETFEAIAAKLDINERTARRVIEDLRQEHCHDTA
jgi:RNA polymerase sigma factor (sigma-70 family)